MQQTKRYKLSSGDILMTFLARSNSQVLVSNGHYARKKKLC